MKVSGTGRVQAGVTRRAGKNGGASAAFDVPDAAPAQEAASVAAPQALAAVDSLLALQEVGDPTQGRRRAVKRAFDLLDLLEDIRFDLIEGGVPLNRLESLIRLTERRRDDFQEPELSGLIDEIELRARVEIAKLEKMRA